MCNVTKTLIAVIVGFALAYAVLPSQPARASGGFVYVTRANMSGGATPPSMGSQIIGFSCVNTDQGAQCYIASQ
jgi:hypothetical protein